MIGRAIGKRAQAPQKIELVLAELGDPGEGLGPGQYRKQGQKQDLLQRVNHLDQLPRIAQILEMIQENNALNESALVRVHLCNLPIESIENSQIQHTRQLSRTNSPDCPGHTTFRDVTCSSSLL